MVVVVEKLSDVLSAEYRGPKAGFTEAQVLKALLEIGALGTVGRGRLGQILGVGQGEVRTLIRRLKQGGLLTIGAEGCRLSAEGAKQFARLSKLIPWRSKVDGSKIGLKGSCFALAVRKRASKISNGIDQRDAAIKSGATAAMTVFYSNGKFEVPPDHLNCEAEGPTEPWSTIRSADLNDGDVIIIASALNLSEAEYGALAASLTVL